MILVGMSYADKAVGWSESKISMIETGGVGVQQPDLEQLLHAVTGDTRAAVLTCAARQGTAS